MSRRLELAALGAILVVALVPRLVFVAHETVVYPDEGFYLELGTNVRDGRGFVSDFKWHHWDDDVTHSEDNRQPALPFALAAIGSVTPDGHERGAGQALVIALSLGVIVATWAYARALFGTAFAGLGAALLVAVQPDFAQLSSIVMTEAPAALAILGVALALRPDRPRTPLRLAVAGGLCAIAYLCRGNGAWIAASIALAMVVPPRPAKAWHWVIPGAVFLVVATPWFVRNERAFGDPLHSIGTVIYVQAHGDDTLILRDEAPSWDSFRATHSSGDLVDRSVRGARLTVSQWGRPGFLPMWVLAGLGIVAATGRRRWLVFALSALGIGFAGIHWLAPVFGVDRYLLPYLPLLAVVGAGVLVRWRPAVGVACVVVAALLSLRGYGPLLQPRNDTYSRKLDAMVRAVDRLPDGAIVAERYGFPWVGTYEYEIRRPIVLLHLAIPIDDALAHARSLGAEYLIVPDTLDGAPSERSVVEALDVVDRGRGWELRAL